MEPGTQNSRSIYSLKQHCGLPVRMLLYYHRGLGGWVAGIQNSRFLVAKSSAFSLLQMNQSTRWEVMGKEVDSPKITCMDTPRPTGAPTIAPTATAPPTFVPTSQPSFSPSSAPSATPTHREAEFEFCGAGTYLCFTLFN
jgi:hypothetical protein